MVQRVLAATACRVGPFPSSTYLTTRHQSPKGSSRRFSCRAGVVVQRVCPPPHVALALSPQALILQLHGRWRSYPAGTTFAGEDFHLLEQRTFARHTWATSLDEHTSKRPSPRQSTIGYFSCFRMYEKFVLTGTVVWTNLSTMSPAVHMARDLNPVQKPIVTGHRNAPV